MDDRKKVNIIGAGLSGLSAAITLARMGVGSHLISSLPSERAQSVLAEGGINAALDTMGEQDSAEEHFQDTVRGGCGLEAESAVRDLTQHAPEVVKELVRLGVPFHRENGQLILRSFGGQRKKRTAYAKSSTGKMIMTAMIDEARRYEAAGLIHRFDRHELVDMDVQDGALRSVTVRDSFTGQGLSFSGPAILCTGGLNGFFEGATTGTTQNTGNAAAIAFRAGVPFANLEMIQYHPTTAQVSDKRMLISEAARGEGGRLFTLKNGARWYFMEEKYPRLGNLMPRDVISREMALLRGTEGCAGEVFLDMTGLDEAVWTGKLRDLRAEILSYLYLDPREEPIPVSPGIHFFMGGVHVNDRHETAIRGLYAAGEAACKYHGANRLGGNSLLGAIYGGRVAAGSAARAAMPIEIEPRALPEGIDSSAAERTKLRKALLSGLGIVRTPEGMAQARAAVEALAQSQGCAAIDRDRALLGLAMIESALLRKESRGAQYRTDYPAADEAYRRFTLAERRENEVRVFLGPMRGVEEDQRL